MSALIRLYPAPWRARYEEEFLDLLEARPPTLGDRFDIIRGAVDARIHPQVRRSPEDPITDERAADLVVARRLGFGALAGGALWVLAWAIAATGPMVYEGHDSYRDGSAAAPFLLLSMILLSAGLVGHLIRLPSGAPIARIGASVAIAFSLLWAFGPWNVILGAVALAGLVAFALGAARARDLSGSATIAVLGGCAAITGFVLVTMGLIGGDRAPYEILFLAAVSAVPIWLGVGGSLVAGSAPARIRPA